MQRSLMSVRSQSETQHAQIHTDQIETAHPAIFSKLLWSRPPPCMQKYVELTISPVLTC